MFNLKNLSSQNIKKSHPSFKEFKHNLKTIDNITFMCGFLFFCRRCAIVATWNFRFVLGSTLDFVIKKNLDRKSFSHHFQKAPNWTDNLSVRIDSKVQQIFVSKIKRQESQTLFLFFL